MDKANAAWAKVTAQDQEKKVDQNRGKEMVQLPEKRMD